MSRKKIFRKNFDICNNCKWFERKINFKYRCAATLHQYAHCLHKYVDLDDFLKKEAENICLHKLEHDMWFLTKDN